MWTESKRRKKLVCMSRFRQSDFMLYATLKKNCGSDASWADTARDRAHDTACDEDQEKSELAIFEASPFKT